MTKDELLAWTKEFARLELVNEGPTPIYRAWFRSALALQTGTPEIYLAWDLANAKTEVERNVYEYTLNAL